jgi:tetratricopeptide (TPR) repeat protein
MRREWILCGLLAALIVAVYWPVRQHDFVCYDEYAMVLQNPLVLGGLTLPGLSWALTTSWFEYWHPVTWLSHMLDCELFGPNPACHHLVSVAFHALNAMLLFLVLQRMTRAFWRSAIVAALFALHPLRVESVAWVAERKDVLSGCFFLLTLWAYARYVEFRSLKSSVQSPESAVSSHVSRFTFHASRITHHAPRFYALALVFFTLALMSKPMVVTLPFVLLLLDLWPLGRWHLAANPTTSTSQPSTLWPLLREKLPFFLLAGLSCGITVRGQRGGSTLSTLSEIGLVERITNAIVGYLQYLGKMFWPTDLAVLYPHPALHYPVSEQWPGWEIFAGALLLLAISTLCLCQLRRRPWLAVGWFWYLGTLVPVIGLVQIGAQAMADRYTYIPLIGPVISLVWLLGELSLRAENSHRVPYALRQTILGALSIGSLTACVLLTHHQIGFWKNSVTLFEHTVEVTPDNPIAQSDLGYGLVLEGKPALAAVRYRVALAINPRFAQPHFNLAGLLKDQERWPEAAEHYLAVTRLKPDWFMAHLALAQILPRLGRTKDAAYHLEEFLRTCPGSNLESTSSAVLEPAVQCLNDLAWLLSTAERAEDRDGPRAVRFAKRACELTQHRQTIMVGTLAAAYAEAGSFKDAVATAETACTLAVANGDQALLEKNRQLLELYRASKPYHESAAP